MSVRVHATERSNSWGKLGGLSFYEFESELQTCRRLQILRDRFNTFPYAIPDDQKKDASFLKVARHAIGKYRLVEIGVGTVVGHMSRKIKVLLLTRSRCFSLQVGKSPFLERSRVIQDLADDLSAGFWTAPELAFDERDISQSFMNRASMYPAFV